MKNESFIELKEEYLLVTSRGTRKDFSEVIEGTLKINEAAKAYGTKYVLADYREVNYEVPLADAFNLVKVYEKKLPKFSDIVISGVINESNLEIGKFWESVCQKRGYKYRVFTTFEKADKWLKTMIKEQVSTK